MDSKSLWFLRLLSYIVGLSVPDTQNRWTLWIFTSIHALIWISVLSVNFYIIVTFAIYATPMSVRITGGAFTVLHVLVNFSTSLNLVYFKREDVQTVRRYLLECCRSMDKKSRIHIGKQLKYLVFLTCAVTCTILPFTNSWRYCLIFLNKFTLSVTVMTICAEMIFLTCYIKKLNEEFYLTLTNPSISLLDTELREQLVLKFSKKYEYLYSLLESVNKVYSFIFLSFSCLSLSAILYFANILMKFAIGIFPANVVGITSSLVECLIYVVSIC